MNEFICCVAGKSGGHIIPGLTWAKTFLEKNLTGAKSPAKIIFFSTLNKLDKAILTNYPEINMQFALNIIDFPGKKIFNYPIFTYLLLKAFFKCLKILFKTKPKKILSLGGLVSIPVCLAAWIMNIPIELFELNAIPGKTIKFLAPFAKQIFVCFDQAKILLPTNKTTYSTYPLRFSEKHLIEKNIAKQKLNLTLQKKTILILGGSQGSQFLNELIIKFFKEKNILANKIQIIHQTGPEKLLNINKIYNDQKIENIVFDFNQDIELYYCAADLVISRAGAGVLFELDFFKKKAIIIPLETSATNHQTENAIAMKKMNPENFIVLKQDTIKKEPQIFFEEIYKHV